MSLRLRDNTKPIPQFGLGTFRAAGTDCYDSCLEALRAGYRLLDTAALYENEAQVGAAVATFLSEQQAVTRNDLYVVTKLHWDSHGAEKALPSVQASLGRLKMDYVDLYLIHSPKGGKVVETYRALVEAKQRGLCRSLGVSNFGAEQLEALIATGLEVPSVNQIELNLWNHQAATVQCCRVHNIVVMAFCPLARCERFGKSGLTEMAKELNTTEAALCNYWIIKNGYVTIPKSTSAARIHDNLKVLDLRLSASDVARLDGFNEGFECSLAVAAMRIPWNDVA